MSLTDHVDTEQLARVAFNAYSETTNWTNVAGKPIPPWEELGEAVQTAWCNAVAAALDSVTEHTNE